MTCLLGLDLGTTNVKALAVHPSDNWPVVAHASVAVEIQSPQPGYAEQDPEAVWQAVVRSITEAVAEVQKAGLPIAAVSFSAAMHSVLAVDDTGKPLTNALLWADNRAEAQAAQLRTTGSALGQAIYEHAGVPIHPMIPLCKLAWFRDNQPDLLTGAARWISLKEYVWWKLTGRYDVDYSIATATGLFDAESRAWYAPALAYAGVRPGQLSEPRPTTYQVAYQPDQNGAVQTDLPAGVPLFIGASDGCLANLGAGSIEAGITTITIGTSGAVRRTVRQPQRDQQGRLFCYYLDERADGPYYVVGGPTNNGANVLEWLAEHLTDQKIGAILTEAATVPAGSDGLLFLPYLHGERAPLWDATARGAYLNVAFAHTRAHFVRAALEGVLFNLLSIEQLLAQQAGPTQIIYANGGFAQSAFWVQIMADIFGVPVRLNASNDSSAMGAVLLVSDLIKPLEEIAKEVQFGATYVPDPSQHETYRTLFVEWERAVKTVLHVQTR